MEKQSKTEETVAYKQHLHAAKLDDTSCTKCDCLEFKPSPETGGGGNTCINLNSEGGTCNHTRDEHKSE